MNANTDMRPAIEAKSDQLNAEDLLGGPLEITITEARVLPGAEQPVIIRYEGDRGKPYKPCKTMCRLLVKFWGADSAQYTGERLTLYHDPEVTWGKVKVGGIRISHMSGIEREQTLALTETRGKRKPHTVKPMGYPAPPPASKERPASASPVDEVASMIEQAKGQKSWQAAKDRLAEIWDQIDPAIAHDLQLDLDAKRTELGG